MSNLLLVLALVVALAAIKLATDVVRQRANNSTLRRRPYDGESAETTRTTLTDATQGRNKRPCSGLEPKRLPEAGEDTSYSVRLNPIRGLRERRRRSR